MKTISSTAMLAGRIAAFGLGLALMVALLVLLPPRPAYAATFTVNKTGDAKDRKINGVCDSSRKRGKQCTLRAAIQEANAAPEADTINFAIGGTAGVKTIKPAWQLPTITEPVTIDGYTQPGASENTLGTGNNAVLLIQLNGTKAGTFADGLTITGANSAIKGLVINGFGESGVRISGSGATGNKVEGNFIGTTADGTAALGLARDGGVNINGAPDNTIGGPEPGARNVISGNEGNGIRIISSGATDNRVEGNFIGTNANGTEALGNTGDGVDIRISAPTNTVGGTQPAQRNVISGNQGGGVRISGATGNEVQGNRIGTNADGTAALGNTGDGVAISDAPNNTVGGTDSGARNIISGNDNHGVIIVNSFATDNQVLGNFIGTDKNGTAALGNGENGVAIFDARENTIGGTANGAGNRIAHNDQDGVSIASGTGNSVLSNLIFSNTGLGIDLGADGVTANDDDDPDTGANNLQNFPVITSATRLSTGVTIISGTLNSNPSQSFTVQCFVAAPDPSGHGEGAILAGQNTTVTTNADGDGSFACASSVPQAGQLVTATATNTSGTATGTAIGDTSEFSQIVGVVAGS